MKKVHIFYLLNMGTCIFFYFYLELFFKGGHDHQSIFSIDIKSLKQPIDYIDIRKLTILFFKNYFHQTPPLI